MIGFIVWTGKFVEFGDKTNDVMTKQKTWKINYFVVFSTGHHIIFQNYEFHFFHAQAECVLVCAVKVELTSGDMRFSDPLGNYSCHIFCWNIAERSRNINFISEMASLSNSIINYL